MGAVDSTQRTPRSDRMIFPARVGTRFAEPERLLRGILRSDDAADDGHHYCDGDAGCMALHHSSECRAAGDPLRSAGSLRAIRIA